MGDAMKDRSGIRLCQLGLLAGVAAVALGSADRASAQAAATTAAADANGVEQIVVTANRRDQNLQSVGGALQVLTGKELDKAGAAKLGDFVLTVPGITFRDLGNGAADLALRGVSNIAADESGSSNTSSTVGLYLGDVPISGTSVFPDSGSYDLARVEVLKGPQGTLYGEGAVGGAIRLIPNPVDLTKLGGTAQLTGSTPEKGKPGGQVRGMLNIPLAQDSVGLRIVGGYSHLGGFIDNIATGQKDINTSDDYNIRGTLLAKVSSNFNVELTALYSQNNADGFNQVNSNLGHFESDATEPRFNRSKFALFSGTLNYDMGFAKLSFVNAYNTFDRTFEDAYPAAATIFSALGVTIHGQPENFSVKQKTYTSELRLVSEGSNRFDYVIGAFYRRRTSNADISLDLFPEDLTAVNAVLSFLKYPTFPDQRFIISLIDTTSRQLAAYGEGTLHITDTFDATVGVRGFTERNGFHSQSISYSVLAILNNTNAPAPTTTSGVVPKFNLTWRPSKQLTVYAQAAEGFRSGGVNFEANLIPGSNPSYDSDKLWNYEIGLRAQLLDSKVNVKAAAFHIDWTKMQLNYTLTDIVGQPLNVVQNGGSAYINGFEAELAAKLTRGLTVGGNFAITGSKLKSVPQGSTIVQGQVLPNVPHFTASAFIDARTPLVGNFDLFGHADIEHTDNQNEQLITTTGIDGYPVKGYDLVNLRFGVENPVWSITAFVKNVGNVQAQLGRGLTYTTASVRENWFTINQPRTYGLTFGVKF